MFWGILSCGVPAFFGVQRYIFSEELKFHLFLLFGIGQMLGLSTTGARRLSLPFTSPSPLSNSNPTTKTNITRCFGGQSHYSHARDSFLIGSGARQGSHPLSGYQKQSSRIKSTDKDLSDVSNVP